MDMPGFESSSPVSLTHLFIIPHKHTFIQYMSVLHLLCVMPSAWAVVTAEDKCLSDVSGWISQTAGKRTLISMVAMISCEDKGWSLGMHSTRELTSLGEGSGDACPLS